MTLALLLEGVYGKLTAMRLHCSDCDADPQLKRARGCGVAPVVDLDTGETWDARAWLEQARESGMSSADIPHQVAHAPYRLANAGQVYERAGVLWDCCPRSLIRRDIAHPLALAHAERVMAMVDTCRGDTHDPGAGRTRALTSYGLDLWRRCRRFWGHLEADEFEARREARERDRAWRESLGSSGGGRSVRRGGRR